MLNYLRSILLALLPTVASAQPTLAWQHNYGGSANEFPGSIQPTTDGGYIVLAFSYSNDGQVTGNHGQADFWAVKLDGSGELEWQRCLGSSGTDSPGAMQQTPDGGYISVGTANTADGDITSNAGLSDIWAVKLSATGTLEWERSYGGSLTETGRWLHVLPNGEVLLFGETSSPEIEGSLGLRDVFVIRIASDGSQLDHHRYGGTDEDLIGYFGYLQDGSLMFSGSAYSSNGHAEGNHGGTDGMVISLDETLNVNWHTCIGGSAYENATAICEDIDGNIYVCVSSNSQNSQITNFHGGTDFWIAKLSAGGDFLMGNSFGGSENDLPWSIIPRPDGGVYVYGVVVSSDDDITTPLGGFDAWLISLDEDLNLLWERTLGGSNNDTGISMCFAPDGGLVLAGNSSSSDGDLTGNFGGGDLWVVKFNPEEVGIAEAEPVPFTLYPNPATNELCIGLVGTTARQLEVVDVTGRIVFTQTVMSGTKTVDLSIAQLAQGTYSVRLVGEGQNYSERFIKY